MHSPSKRLIIDLDGVLADFNHGFITLAEKILGRPMIKREPPWWDLSRSYGLAPGEETKIWEEGIKNSERFWLDLPAHPSTTDLSFVHLALAQRMCDIYYVTMRGGREAKVQSEQWLYNHGITYPTVIMTGEKAEFARIIRADAVIEDSPTKLKEYAALGGVRVYAMLAPYNEHLNSPGLRFVKTFDEFIIQEGL